MANVIQKLNTHLGNFFSSWLPVAVWAVLIFVGSSIPNADFSDNLETERLIHLVAHLVEYGVLGFLLIRGLRGTFVPHLSHWNSGFQSALFATGAVLLATLYAFTDEYHQLFVVGRIAKLTDVYNDTIGAVLGILCYLSLNRSNKSYSSYTTTTNTQTERLGQKLAQQLKGGEVIALYGELGSGKTTFVRGLFKGLGCQGRVLSPTFVLMRIYKGGRLRLIHVDLYRLESFEEIESLGLSEYLNDHKTVVVIEWAEKAEALLPEDAVRVKFEYVDEGSRRITVN